MKTVATQTKSGARLALAAATLLLACVADDDGGGIDDATGTGSDDDASQDDGGSTTDDGETMCPTPTDGPTHHADDIIGEEVWTAQAGPHIVDATLRIRDGARLVIEPCARVELAENAGLQVAFPGTPTTGALVARGEPERPIEFAGFDGARWGHILAHAPGTVELAHVVLQGGGGDEEHGATLVARGARALPTEPLILAQHVTVRDSLGAGVVVFDKASFDPRSDALVVVESGNDSHPFPIEVDEHAMGSIPAGTYTGNAVDAIFVDPLDSLREDARLRDLGVPYRVGDSPQDDLVVGGGDARVTTLSIDPGVRLEFHRDTALVIERATGAFPALGALVANGTVAAPIVFSSAESSPAPGDWIGLWLGGQVAPTTRISHSRIEYAGAECGCVLLTCSQTEGTEGAVIMTQPPDTAFVTDSVISHSAGNGFVLGYDGPLVDFAGVNGFDDVAWCDVTLPRDGQCPDPLPSCE